jgi:hypothetical protein
MGLAKQTILPQSDLIKSSTKLGEAKNIILHTFAMYNKSWKSLNDNQYSHHDRQNSRRKAYFRASVLLVPEAAAKS